MPYTTSVAGTAITASWANASVRDQGVTPFADSTARSAAITSPVDGMLSVLTTTDRVDVYNGTSWSALVAPSNGALTAWTPTVTQSGSVTVTNTYSRYMRVGRMIIGNAYVTVTGSGTGANNIIMSLPVTSGATNLTPIGAGDVFDSSAGLNYTGTLLQVTTTSAVIAPLAGANYLGASSMTAALASPDTVGISFHYEAAADG